MKTFSAYALMAVMTLGTAGLVGCDETVSKTEETKVRSDGSTVTKEEKTVRESDGTVKKESHTEKTPPTTP